MGLLGHVIPECCVALARPPQGRCRDGVSHADVMHGRAAQAPRWSKLSPVPTIS